MSYFTVNRLAEAETGVPATTNMEVTLGTPFTSAQQPWLGPASISFEKALEIFIALDMAARCQSTLPLGAGLGASALLLHSKLRTRARCFSAEANAKVEILQAFTARGGVWCWAEPKSFLSHQYNKDVIISKILLCLEDFGEGGQQVLEALHRQVALQDATNSAPLLLLGAFSKTEAPLQLEHQFPVSRSSTAQMSTAASRVGVFDSSGCGEDFVLEQLVIMPLIVSEMNGAPYNRTADFVGPGENGRQSIDASAEDSTFPTSRGRRRSPSSRLGRPGYSALRQTVGTVIQTNYGFVNAGTGTTPAVVRVQ